MLYVAFFKIKPGLTAGSPEIIEKSRKWWDGGGKPAGLKTVGVFSCLGTDTRDVLIFEAQSHDDIREMVISGGTPPTSSEAMKRRWAAHRKKASR
jgi:hypothetical protein